VGRSFYRLKAWRFLVKQAAEPGNPNWIRLNRNRVDEALTESRNILMNNQANTGFIEYLH